MSVLECICGHDMHNTDEKLTDTFRQFLFTSSELDIYDDAIIEHKEDIPDIRELWQCPKCKRIAIDDDTESGKVTWYRPEIIVTNTEARQMTATILANRIKRV